MKLINLTHYSDPAHGWIAVKLGLLKTLGIDKLISPYSYIRGQTAYLEEDRDATLLIKRLDHAGFEHETKYRNVPYGNSPIRSYEPYPADPGWRG